MRRERRKYFITGLLIILPVLCTVYLFVSLFVFFDNILGRYVSRLTIAHFGFKIPGLGLLIFIALTFGAGIFATNFLGRKLLLYFERLWLKFPIIKRIYPAIKQIISFFFTPKNHSEIQKVVLIEYPRKGIYTVGFVTNRSDKSIEEKAGRELLNVLIPSVPSPFTGVVVLVPLKDVIFLDIGIEEAIKLFISGGVVNPGESLSSLNSTVD